MPRRRDWDDLSAAYRKRFERYGIGSAYYETGGTLQLARGHRPREFARRAERNPGILSSNDYRFLKKQAERNGIADGDENPLTDFYKSLSRDQRSLLRDRVANERRMYKRRGLTKNPDRAGDLNSKGRVDYLRGYVRDLKNDYPWFPDELVGLAFYH